MGSNPQFVATYRSTQTQLVAAHAKNPRPIWTPGANGSRIHSINIATDDSTASQTILLYRAVEIETNASMTPAALTATPTITRSIGSFVTDGWQVNQRAFLLGSNNLSNDQATVVTTVAAGTLTITGTFTAESSWPGALYRASLIATISLPASSGAAAATPPLNVLNPNLLPTLVGSPDNFFVLGSNDLLLAAVGNTNVASAKSVDIVVEGGDY
jgi:hypothetical protein